MLRFMQATFRFLYPGPDQCYLFLTMFLPSWYKPMLPLSPHQFAHHSEYIDVFSVLQCRPLLLRPALDRKTTTVLFVFNHLAYSVVVLFILRHSSEAAVVTINMLRCCVIVTLNGQSIRVIINVSRRSSVSLRIGLTNGLIHTHKGHTPHR